MYDNFGITDENVGSGGDGGFFQGGGGGFGSPFTDFASAFGGGGFNVNFGGEEVFLGGMPGMFSKRGGGGGASSKFHSQEPPAKPKNKTKIVNLEVTLLEDFQGNSNSKFL